MSTRQQADENTIDYVLLADNDFGDFLAHLIEVASCELKSGVGRHLSILDLIGALRLREVTLKLTCMLPVNPSSDPAQQRLTQLRNGLLSLHKILLDSERARYERDVARISSSGELLNLVLYDPWFAWLHELSELVVLIDETLDAKEPPNGIDAERLVAQARELVAPNENGAGFRKSYFEAMQNDPDVVLAHGQARKLLSSLG